MILSISFPLFAVRYVFIFSESLLIWASIFVSLKLKMGAFLAPYFYIIPCTFNGQKI